MPKSKLSFRFFTFGAPTVNITGWVESCESPIFSKNPEAVISVLCLNPDFYELTPVVINGNTVSDLTTSTIDYVGSVDTGIIFRLNVNRALAAFTVYDGPSDTTLRIFEFAAPLVAGDVIEINTAPGVKTVVLTRAGITTSILYGVGSFADWIKLTPGINKIRVSAVGVAVPYTIEYTNKFGGL